MCLEIFENSEITSKEINAQSEGGGFTSSIPCISEVVLGTHRGLENCQVIRLIGTCVYTCATPLDAHGYWV